MASPMSSKFRHQSVLHFGFSISTLAVFQLKAQEVFAPPPRGGESPAQSYAVGVDPALGVDFLESSFLASLLENPLQWGPFRVSPHPSYRFTYGNGVSRSPGNQQNTVLQQVSPGVSLASEHLVLDYTPSLYYYSNPAFEDSLTHSASVASRFGYGDWSFSISYDFFDGSTAVIETAQPTERQSHSTSLAALWFVSDRTSIDFSVGQSIELSESFNNSREWYTMEWLNYLIGANTSIGVGVGGGYSQMDLGFDMTYETLLGRLAWSPTDKISFSFTAGGELRQFLDFPNSDSHFNPTFSAALSYKPWKPTTFSLSANRALESSIYSLSVIETQGITAHFQQRLLERFSLGLSGGIRSTDYGAVILVERFQRSDSYTFFSASLGTRIFANGSASIFFQQSDNSSNLAGFDYDTTQYGFQLAYRF